MRDIVISLHDAVHIILIDITCYILFNPYLMNVDLAIFGNVSLLMVQNQCCFPD